MKRTVLSFLLLATLGLSPMVEAAKGGGSGGGSGAAPTVSYTLSGTKGNGNWYTSDVTLTWTYSGSRIRSVSGCNSVTLTSDTALSTYSCSVTNANGTTTESVSFGRDASPPVVSEILTGVQGNNGWYTSDVSLTWSTQDSVSGISGISGCANATVTSDTAGASFSCTATNGAGLASTPKTVTIKRDATPPTINLTSPANASYVQGQSLTASYSCSDASSGIGSCSGPVINGGPVSTSAAGNYLFTVNAVDNAGNLAVTSASYTITPSSGGGTSGNSSLKLLAWNDLGMHCMDSDYSVFSILPPFNNLHAQVVDSATGKLVTSNIQVTYEKEVDPSTGHENSTSDGKTNFWDYIHGMYQFLLDYFAQLFGIPIDGAPDQGTTGAEMPGSGSMPMRLTGAGDFVAEGIPITPYDDAGEKNYYPMFRVKALDSSNNVLATARVVLPVSDEMTCKGCHASNSRYTEALPASPVTGVSDPEKEYRLNILKKHDEKRGIALTSEDSLFKKAMEGTPTLCASCHGSNALQTTGTAKPLTQVMHDGHKGAIWEGSALGASNNRSACYACHPGSQTNCLRGAMSGSDMQCQSCHGNMADVGNSNRAGWFNEPNCQACHYNGTRQTSALLNGVLRTTTDTRFATNPNTPAPGLSLYRFSKGHGGLYCESCHGSTHAEYKSFAPVPGVTNLTGTTNDLNPHYNDNLQPNDLQGHTGVVTECTLCHKAGFNESQTRAAATAGPHGMHPIGDGWVKWHHDNMGSGKSTCRSCHGATLSGSPLAVVKVEKTFKTKQTGVTKTYHPGDQVKCDDCHSMP